MKLSQLYSNDPKHFPPILFNGIEDKDLSVIYARVKKPKDAQKDTSSCSPIGFSSWRSRRQLAPSSPSVAA